MSLVSTNGIRLIPDLSCSPFSWFTGLLMDATGERLGTVLEISKSGNIRNVWFRTANVVEEDTLKVSLQGVSSGVPDGTILGTGNNGYVAATLLDTSDNTWLGPFQLGVDVAVTRGQMISVVFEWNSYSDGNLNLAGSVLYGGFYNCYAVTDITASPGTWAKGSTVGAGICVALEYDDGTYAFPCFGYGGGILTINSGSAPDEAGNYFSSPFPFRAVGFYIYGDFDYDVTLSLLDSSNNVLANKVLDSSVRQGAGNGLSLIFFDSDPAASVNIAKDTGYRVIASPGANSVSFRYFDIPEADAMDGVDLGSDCVYTQRNDGGVWSDTGTRRMIIGLIADQVDNGVGSGGGGPLVGPSALISG